MDKLLRTAYYIVKKEKPFADFKELLQLQNYNGLSLWETYFNEKAAKEFISHIANFHFDELKGLLKSAKYFSMFCDGSTDRTESEKEIIMVKVLDNYFPVVKYLKLEETNNAKQRGSLLQ